MNTKPRWALEPDAAEHLAISTVTLRLMRREGRLTAGRDWIYLTGSKGGPVGYDLAAVEKTLAERTAELVATEKCARPKQEKSGPPPLNLSRECRHELHQHHHHAQL